MYKFKEGDGVTHITCSVEERENITKLLKKYNYELYTDYRNFQREYGHGYSNQFNNNFRFNKSGKWVTSSASAVTNPLTFHQMETLILGKREINYEIY